MQQQQNKKPPVLTMRMLLFLCTSMMMTSPVVAEGVHTVRVATAVSEATTTATNTNTMRMKRRSVQDTVGVRVSSESGVRNFIDINNNNDATTNQPSPEDDDHDENHDDHNDHTTFTFTELYNEIMNNSDQANNNEAADESDVVVMNFNDINNNDANQQRPEDDDHDTHHDNRDHTFTFTELLPTAAADPTNNAEPIMNYNDLNNHDAAVDESSEVVMTYNDLNNATTVDAAATIDIVTPIMNYNDLNSNNDAADESSEVVMNYNDLTNATTTVDAAVTTDIIVSPIMNYNDLTDATAAAAAAAADAAAPLELVTQTMTPPQENTVILGRASTATSACACRTTDTTDVIRARINNGETRPPCQETDLTLDVWVDTEIEAEVVEVAGIELEVVTVEIASAGGEEEKEESGEGGEEVLGVNIISLGEYDSLYGTTTDNVNENEKTTETVVIVDDMTTTADTVIADASRSSVDDTGSTTKQLHDPMVITTICFGILIVFLLLLLVCNYRCWKLQKQRAQEELCGQYVFDIPDHTSHSENDEHDEDDDEDSAAVLKDGEMEYPIHKIVVGSSPSAEEDSHGKLGIRRKLSRLVEYVVSIKTNTRNGQADILTDVHRCTSAFCPVCEKQRKAVMSCESYDIKIAGQQQQQQQEAIPQDDDEEEQEEEHGSVIYVPRGDEEMGVGASFYVYETDNDNAEIETRHERHTVFQSPTKRPLLPPSVHVPIRRPTGTSSRNRSRTTATATAKPRREPVPAGTVRRPRSHKAQSTRRRDP